MKGTLTKAFYNRAIIGVIAVAVIVVIILGWPRKDPRLTADEKKALKAYRPLICENAYSTETHYEEDNREYIDIKLTPGCFSGFVAVPDKWKTWQGQLLGDQPTDWVAEWYAGWNGPAGPWSEGQINSGKVDLVRTTRKLRAEGQGTLRLYRITGDESQTKEGAGSKGDNEGSSPAGLAKKIARTRIGPLSGANDRYAFYLEECARNGESIACEGLVENQTDAATELSLGFGSQCTDDEGHTMGVNDFRYSNTTSLKLLPNVKTRFFVRVYDPHMNVKTISLQLSARWDNRADPRDEMVFEHVPVQ